MFSINKKKSHDEIIRFDYIKPVHILEKYINNFFYRAKILDRKSKI